MLITARYGGSSCATCSRAIAAGDRISYAGRGLPVLHAACSDEGKESLAKTEASRAVRPLTAIEVPAPDGREFLPFQKAGVAFILARLAEGRGTLLADQMGTGKSVQTVGVVNASPDVRTVLLVCPASLKLNWREEFRRWSTRDLSVGVFGHGASLRGERFDVTIVSYDVLADVSPVSTGKTAAEILHRGEPLPKTATWDLLVIDECHFAKNPKASRTKALQEIKKRVRATLALTGTPIPNKPIELFPILQLVDPLEWDPAGIVKGQARLAGEGAGFFRFVKKFCNAHQKMVAKGKLVWDFDGASNLPELNDKLRAGCMVRRLKADVLKDLPAKVRQIVPIGNGEDDESRWGDLGDDYETATKRVASIPFTELSRARHAQAKKKVKPALEHLASALDSNDGGKIIVFAHHLDVHDALIAGLADYGVVSLKGDDNIDDRNAAVERFQNDPACRVFVGSLKAAGVGLTLTASAHVVFVESDWVPAVMTQAEDRAHRIGQRESVLIQILVLEGSLDAKMMRFVAEKQAVADLALDDETIPDVSDRPVVAASSVEGADPTVNPAPLPSFAPGEIEQIHEDLRTLASVCDGAVSQDGAGFNGMDSNFGKTLAALPRLSLRQAAAARKMLGKYARQLGRGPTKKHSAQARTLNLPGRLLCLQGDQTTFILGDDVTIRLVLDDGSPARKEDL